LALDTVTSLVAQFGGRSVVRAELRSCPDGVELPGQLEDQILRFESEQPLEEVTRLTRCGVEIQSLRITEPDLETVFLSLTGRSLRD
jgi:ABC-2 type transport system ATP-binding protein